MPWKLDGNGEGFLAANFNGIAEPNSRRDCYSELVQVLDVQFGISHHCELEVEQNKIRDPPELAENL